MSKANVYVCDACRKRAEPKYGFPEGWVRLRYEADPGPEPRSATPNATIEWKGWQGGEFCCFNCAKAWMQTCVEIEKPNLHTWCESRKFWGCFRARLRELVAAELPRGK